MATRRERYGWCREHRLGQPPHTGLCWYCPHSNQTNSYNVPTMTRSNGYYPQPLPPPMVCADNDYPKFSIPPPVYSTDILKRPPQVSSSAVHGRKRAVLCGISYRGQKNSIKGSVNDVRLIKSLLVDKMRFPDASILVLTEEELDPSRVPSKRNMLNALRWLVQGCQSGDSLLFYYSGHGSRIRDLDGDEMDGFDESLCPVDYKTAGKIVDDDINATIVRLLPRGAKLHAIIDTCFSGTVLDLQFMCTVNPREGNFMWEDNCNQYTQYKGTGGGIAVCLSACHDNQYSADTTAFTGSSTGALTYSFIKALENEPDLTYGRLLIAMRNKVSEAQRRVGIIAPPQEPQMSSSVKFDIHSTRFRL